MENTMTVMVPMTITKVTHDGPFDGMAVVQFGQQEFHMQFDVDVEVVKGEAAVVSITPIFHKGCRAIADVMTEGQVSDMCRFIKRQISATMNDRFVYYMEGTRVVAEAV
jgi:hypothetical protein